MAGLDPKEIRESFTADEAQWHDIRAARRADLQALSPDSTWDDDDRKARKNAGRPCLAFDELGQYVNQLVNDARNTKRAIEVNPQGSRTSEAQARFIGALIRQIEYDSNAQLAYTQMFEDAAQGGYGFCRIVPEYLEPSVDTPSARSFDQKLLIKAIPNPDLVTPGYFTLPDLSDCTRYWIEESYTEADYKRRFKQASKLGLRELASEGGKLWASGDRIWVRELWQLDTRPRKLALLPPLEPGGEPVAVWADEIPKGAGIEPLKVRTVDEPYVCQTITNGVEILEETTDWPGRYLPIVGCVGKVLWLENERQILSLIRLAKDPQQLYNYYRTSEAEIVGMTPKVPWFHYGNLDPTNETALVESNQRPVGAIKVKPTMDGWNPAHGPMPFPARVPFEPPIQAFEMGAESTRRAIQSATGTGFLPTEAQRVNQKSGVALREIQTSAQKGAYHFVDHYEHSIRRVGEILVDLIPHYYDTPRDISVRTKTDQPIAVRINDPQAPAPKEFAGKDGEPGPLMATEGEFDITLSTGPSYASERDKASEFADSLVAARPEVFQILGPEIIRLKNLGPIGDQMAEFLEAMQPPQIQQLRQGTQPVSPQVQQMQVQLQQAQQVIQQLQAVIQGDQVKGQTQIAIKKIDGQIRLALETLKGQQRMTEKRVDVAAAIDTREDEQAHDLAMAGAGAAHAADQAERAAARADVAAALAPERA